MRREGKPRGMVRTYHVIPTPLNPRQPRPSRILASPPTAGVFTKVPNKPTNHSKFTGKCDRPGCATCHINAGSKSKEKSKGTQKMKSSDDMLNYKHISYTVSNDPPVSAYKGRDSGFSASDVLLELADNDNFYYDDDGDDGEECAYVGVVDDLCYDEYLGGIAVTEVRTGDVHVDDVDGDGSEMSFYDVAVAWDPTDEDDGWSMVVGDYM